MKKLSHSAIVIFVALLTSLMLCGCSKEEEMTITVYGTVFIDSNPLQGATVSVSIKDDLRALTKVSQTVTGSDGTYETTFTIIVVDENGNNHYPTKEGHITATPVNTTRYLDNSSNFSYATSSKVHIDINMRSY